MSDPVLLVFIKVEVLPVNGLLPIFLSWEVGLAHSLALDEGFRVVLQVLGFQLVEEGLEVVEDLLVLLLLVFEEDIGR